MRTAAIRSWWQSGLAHVLARLTSVETDGSLPHPVESVGAETGFWSGFARQPDQSPAEETETRTVKPLSLLVPTDFSAASLPAVACALRLAVKQRTHLTLLHAIHLQIHPFGPANTAQIKTALCQEAMAKADPILLAAKEMGVSAVCMLAEGAPAKAIAEAADRCEPDLVIMTKSPRGTLARLFGRRTAEQVVRAAQCPVMVLPAA